MTKTHWIRMLSPMKYVFDYKELAKSPAEPRVTTIGNFDGVHVGHQAVLARAKRDADQRGMELAVLTFEPHPAELFKPDGPRLRLVDPKRKVELLASCGADVVLAQQFDEEFARLSAEQFATDVLAGALGAKHIIIGENFRFGREREGDVEALKALGEKLGFEVSGEALVKSEATDVSSSRVRKVLLEGNVAEAAQLLGRYHEVSGVVTEGRGEGEKLGFPTINLDNVKVVVPTQGIYAAYCDVDGATFQAAAYLGDRPTFGFGYSVEAHLLDCDKNLYGKRVVLRLVERIRGDMKFDSVEALTEQIAKDVGEARSLTEAGK